MKPNVRVSVNNLVYRLYRTEIEAQSDERIKVIAKQL
jgi:hypothetical protein